MFQRSFPRHVSTLAGQLLILGLLLSSGHALGQDDGSRLFFDAIDVRVVNVEAVVTDENGDSVSGLTADDFTVLENGEPVEITNFFAVEGSEIVGSDEEDFGLESTPDTAGPETRNLNLVLLIDNIHIDPRNRNQIFAELKQFLGRLNPEDRILIVTLGDTLNVETRFTDDAAEIASVLGRLEKETGPSLRTDISHRQILRAIQSTQIVDAAAGGFGSSRFGADETASQIEGHLNQIRAFGEERAARSRATLEVMTSFTSSLAGMQGRKALLYISDGLSTRPIDGLLEAWQGRFSDWLNRNDFQRIASRGVAVGSQIGNLSRDLDEFGLFAAANKVAIYPISPGSRLIGSAASAESAGSFSASGAGGASKLAQSLEQTALEESLLRMADQTGGVAFTRTANVEGLFNRIRSDFSSFYSIGFQPRRSSGETSKIEIRVGDKKWNVRYGTAAVDKDPLEQLKDRIVSSMSYGLGDNPLQVELAPVEEVKLDDGHIQLSMMVKIPFQKILLLPEESAHAGRLTLFVVVRDEENKRLSPFQQVEIPLQIPNEQILQVMTQSAGYPLTMNTQPGPKRIAIGLRDRLAQVDSTLFYDLDVGASSAREQVESP